jgi:hypothetical protein
VPAPAAPADPVRDHDTIVRMQGEYTVDFAFDETVLLQPGYARAPAMRSGGNELVVVVEDTHPHRAAAPAGGSASGHVTKHWRQDWTYEAPVRFEFSADQTWRVRALPADHPGAGPSASTKSATRRATAHRRWRYTTACPAGPATSWRPLPRREYTKRSDYNALAVVNRHTLTPMAGPTSSSTPRCAQRRWQAA